MLYNFMEASNEQLDLSSLMECKKLGILLEYEPDEVAYDEEQFLGKGTSGKVYKSKIFKNSKVIKVVEGKKINKSIQGLKLQSILNHPNILLFQGYCYTNQKLHLVLPYLSEGTLSDCIQKINKLEQKQKQRLKLEILINIASGLAFIHQKELIHQDLKPANILLDENHVPYIADFDFSADLKQKNINKAGTKGFMAPEQENQKELPTPKVDIYSFGKIAEYLFKEGETDCTPMNFHFLKNCCKVDPKERPTSLQLVADLSNSYKQQYGQKYKPNIKRYRNTQTEKVNNNLHYFYALIIALFIWLLLMTLYSQQFDEYLANKKQCRYLFSIIKSLKLQNH